MQPDKTSLLYRSGNLFLNAKTRHTLQYYFVGDDNSLFYINGWTVVHWLSGIIFAALITDFSKVLRYNIYSIGLIVHTIWELWQLVIGMTAINLRGIIDITMDTCVFLFGVWVYLYSSGDKGDRTPG